MASTGLLLALFLAAHASGNASLFAGTLNRYAAGLRILPPALWLARAALLALFGIHVWMGVALTLESRGAGGRYAVTARRGSTLASRTMIWTGLAVGAFLLFHLLHFTLGAVHPASSALRNLDAAGRPDVEGMVRAGFAHVPTALAYLAALAALGMHLFHGLQSAAQTLGLHGERGFPHLRRAGRALGMLAALAFASVPAALLAGLVR